MSKNLIIYLLILPALLFSAHLAGQDIKTLYGKVLNDQGRPVINVTISIPGVDDPVYTDESGAFNLYDLKGDEWLLVRPLDEYH